MEVLKEQHEVKEQKTPKEEKQLSREERRLRDRINGDAQKTFVALAEKFRECFMDEDPNGLEVIEKQKEVNAKWRVYCKSKGLIPEALISMSEYCEGLINQYKSELNDTPQTEPEPSH